MGTVFKKQVTRPLPPGAEIFVRKGERFARWKDRRGKTRTAPLTVGKDGGERLLIESPFYVAKYRDGGRLVQTVSTGCRDEQAARRVLADLERRAELVKAGVMTTGEDAIAAHQATALPGHFDAFEQHLQAKGVTTVHQENTRRQLERVARDCVFARLADLDQGAFERWLAERTAEGMSARNRNAHREALIGFANWCVRTKRLTANPFRGVMKANQKADPRRQRRAMDEGELVRLLDVARRRPLLDALTVRKGPRKGERYADVRPEVRQALDLIGRERALIYKTLVLTGLRKGELASLTVASLNLEADLPFVQLAAADEKNREGNAVTIRADLAVDLRQWLADKLHRLQAEALATDGPIPARLPPDTPLFNVPAGLLRILDRDLKLAGIPKRDDRGRTLDVHALRHTFGSLLSRGGVAPRTAQAAMRHGSIDLTMNVYTDPRMLDVAGALDALPALPLNGDQATREAAKATGTEGVVYKSVHSVAPTVAPTWCNGRQSESIPVKMAGDGETTDGTGGIAVSGDSVKGKRPLTSAVNGLQSVGATGFEPATSWSRTNGDPNASIDTKEVTDSSLSRCTNGCTSEAENDNAGTAKPGTVEALAAALRGLSASDRARLAALLTEGRQGEQGEGKENGPPAA